MARSETPEKEIIAWEKELSSRPPCGREYVEGFREGAGWSERWKTMVILDDDDDDDKLLDGYDDNTEEEQWKTIRIVDDDDDDDDAERRGRNPEEDDEEENEFEGLSEDRPLKSIGVAKLLNGAMDFADNGNRTDMKSTGSRSTCEICFAEEVLTCTRRQCCSLLVCRPCFRRYLTSQIDDGNTTIIYCPGYECHTVITAEEIRQTVDIDTRSRYESFLVSPITEPIGLKTCPQCKAITVVSERLLDRAKQKRLQLKVICPVCDLEWYYECQSPSHSHETCRKMRASDAEFKHWTRGQFGSQRNARRCPQCRVYIQKNSGCDHIRCSQCRTHFCYGCGRNTTASGKHLCSALPPRTGTNDCGVGGVFLIVTLAPLWLPVAALALPFLLIYGAYRLDRTIRVRPARQRRRR